MFVTLNSSGISTPLGPQVIWEIIKMFRLWTYANTWDAITNIYSRSVGTQATSTALSLRQPILLHSGGLYIKANMVILNDHHCTHRADQHRNWHNCIKKTTLNEIKRWTEDFGRYLVFWFNRLAGMQKSTIVQTIAEQTFANDPLRALLFYLRGIEGHSSLQLIFPIYASQLACVSLSGCHMGTYGPMALPFQPPALIPPSPWISILATFDISNHRLVCTPTTWCPSTQTLPGCKLYW